MKTLGEVLDEILVFSFRTKQLEALAAYRAQVLEEAAEAMEFQVGESLETLFDQALVDGGIAVIRALKDRP